MYGVPRRRGRGRGGTVQLSGEVVPAVDRVILHLDMDAFFAAVEQRERPELRGKPVLIGHPGPRGVVATCSYEARTFGIRSAMPSVTAERLCPHGVWVSPRFELYSATSRRIFEHFARLVPVVEQVSVDEAYGDLTGAVADLDEGVLLAVRLKEAIRAGESLTASAGVSYCRYLAKIASDLEKPDGLVRIGPEDVEPRIWPLAARVIPGVGPKTAERLARFGLKTVGDLACCAERRLVDAVGATMAAYLVERALGHDDTPVEPHGERKQVSEERTYGTDLRSADEIERELLARAEGVAAELRRKGVLARTVTIKVRDGAYNTVTRARTLEEPTDLASELYHVGLALFTERVDLHGRGVRLLGLGAKDLLHPSQVPPTLFPDERRLRAHAIARAADRLREKFGDDAVRPARLVRPDDHDDED